MKIAVCTDSFPPGHLGGAELVAARLAGEYRRLGHDVVVVTTTPAAEDAGASDWQGIQVHRVHAPAYADRWRAYRSLRNPRVATAVRRVLEREKVDAVHAHNLHQHLSYQLLRVVSDLGVPATALTFHDVMAVDYGKLTGGVRPGDVSDDPIFDERVRPWRTLRAYGLRYCPPRNAIIRRYVHRHVRSRIAVSSALRRVLQANGLACTDVIHNGVDPDDWSGDAGIARGLADRLGIAGRRVLLFGGRVSSWKGSLQMVEALPALARAVPDVSLLVIGREGPDTRDMRSLAERLGVARHLVFAGWLAGPELVAAYGISDVVVVPSLYFDPFPTAVLEAMAAARPVVATCLGGSREAVIDGETGFIVNPFNRERLEQRLITLLRDEGRAQAMGRAGRERLVTHFTLRRSALAYLSALQAG